MTIFVVVSFKKGVSGSLYVEAQKAFHSKDQALEFAAKQNINGLSGAWSFVSETELV